MGNLAKRYLLMVADGDLTEADGRALAGILEQRHGKVKVISVEGAPRALIVKTTQAVAPALREQSGDLVIGGKRLRTVLTSGAIGNLKRRAKSGASSGNGQALQR